VTDEVKMLWSGGTLAVILACCALKRGYQATLYSYNLNIFDPTWFHLPSRQMVQKLKEQLKYKRSKKIRFASKNYIEFLELGGNLKFSDLTAALIRSYLNQGLPILTGLSSTYLYKSPRESGPLYKKGAEGESTNNSLPHFEFDDIRGEPAGHFVVLTAYDREKRQVVIADPYQPNPLSESPTYSVSFEHLISSIMLGILTYDANLLVIKRKDPI